MKWAEAKHQRLDWATCLSPRHAQFNWKSDFFGLPNRTFQGRSLPDRWSRGTRTLVVYYLHGETGSSTVCANGKQKCLMVISVRIDHLPFTQQPPIYQESLGRVRSDHNSKMAGKNCKCKHIFHTDISVGNFGLPLKTFPLFRKFSFGLEIVTHSALSRAWKMNWIWRQWSVSVWGQSSHSFPTMFDTTSMQACLSDVEFPWETVIAVVPRYKHSIDKDYTGHNLTRR